MAAKIELIISGDNTGAVNALRGLANVVINVNNTINNVNHNINNFNNQINNFGDGLRNGQSSVNGFMSSLSRLTMVGAGVVGVLYAIKETVEKITMPGFNFSKDMEMNELGIAGIIQSMTLLNGKAVAFGEAMQISDDIVAKLQKDAIRTGATMKELVTVYRAILAPGIGAGMSLDEIQKITTMGANAVKAIMPGNGQAQMQMVQELRDLVQGGIQASSSTLATSLGITDADIKRAKNSTEGLFKFLMDRLQGFQDVSKAFPDTMQGKMDNLAEVATLASAEITKEFEGDFKSILTELISLFGELNTETGNLELNPKILTTIQDIRKETSDWFSIIKQINIIPISDSPFYTGLADIYKITKDIVSTVVDLGTVINKLLSQDVFDSAFAQGFALLTENIKGYLDTISEAARILSGRQLTTGPDGSSLSNPNIAGSNIRTIPTTNDDRAAYEASKVGNLTPKFRNQQKDIETSQAALKIALDQIHTKAEIEKAKIKAEIEALEVQIQQTNNLELIKQKTILEQKMQSIDVQEIQQKIGATGEAQFKDSADKDLHLQKLQGDFDVASTKMQKFGVAVDEVTNVAGNMKTTFNKGYDASNQYYVLQGSTSMDGVQQQTQDAFNYFAYVIKMMKGWQVEVTSTTGGKHAANSDHYKGLAIDYSFTELADKAAAQSPRGMEMATLADEIAQKLGWTGTINETLPENRHYGSGDVVHAAGAPDVIKTLDVGDTTNVARVQKMAKDIYTKQGQEYFKAILELYDQADDISKKLAETHGDISSRQKAELSAKYDAQIKKFKLNGMDSFADTAQKLKESEFAKLDFAQSQKNIDIANGELITTQKNLMNDLAKGTKSAAEVTQEYTDTYNAKVKAEVTKLEQQLADAVNNDRIELANSIRAELRKIPEAINEFAEKVIQKINSDLQADINSINANRSLTSMQKKDAIEEKQRKAYGDTADLQEKEAKNLRGMSEDAKAKSREQGIDPDVTAATLEQQAALNRKYEELPSLLDKIHQSSKQAFEDGLLDFLSRGIIECKNLGEAIRNLAISVLQSIQKIYSEAMTKNIMSMMGFGANPRPTIDNVVVQGPLRPNGKFAEGGDVQGPGTGTSDSIFAKLSNGEFIIKASSVQKYGKNFLHRLNNGFVPTNLTPRFATGGLVGSSADGAAGIASSIQGGDVTVPLKVVNITDPNEVGRYLTTRAGERVMVNFMKNNAGTMRQILNIRG